MRTSGRPSVPLAGADIPEASLPLVTGSAEDPLLGCTEGGSMDKLDLRKELKHLYNPSARTVAVVDVPEFQFLMLDGGMEPGATPETSGAFHDGLQALYGASFTLKFMSKLREENPIDYKVMALEGLWWTESGGLDFDRQDDWQWTLMMLQPDHITAEMVLAALEQVRAKQDNPALERMRFERFHEGLCMQIMHVGPYADEPRTVEKMMAFARENGYRLRGKHHEIYIGDPRRAKPERLRTVLRQPIEKPG
jgi:hypothetical protein